MPAVTTSVCVSLLGRDEGISDEERGLPVLLLLQDELPLVPLFDLRETDLKCCSHRLQLVLKVLFEYRLFQVRLGRLWMCRGVRVCVYWNDKYCNKLCPYWQTEGKQIQS